MGRYVDNKELWTILSKIIRQIGSLSIFFILQMHTLEMFPFSMHILHNYV